MSTSPMLKFPAQNTLIGYLENHQASSSIESDIIKKVCEVFAKREINAKEAKDVVLVILISLKLPLQPLDLVNMQTKLFAALKDCTAGVPIKQASKL